MSKGYTHFSCSRYIVLDCSLKTLYKFILQGETFEKHQRGTWRKRLGDISERSLAKRQERGFSGKNLEILRHLCQKKKKEEGEEKVGEEEEEEERAGEEAEGGRGGDYF